MASGENILGQFLGSDDFPVAWESEQEQGLFWVYDDLHCPHPLSPMYFDIGGWWLSCDHMFRRFGTPFAVDWLAKSVNGYLYTAAIPGDPDLIVSAREYGRRYWARVPVDRDYAAKLNAYSGKVLPVYGQHFADWWRDRLVPEMERNFAYLEAAIDRASDLSLAELAVLLEDAIDIHDRHWKIHWMLNFAQFSASMRLREAMAKVRGGVDEQLLGRLQNSAADRNWDSVEGLWAMKEQVRQSPDLSAAFAAGTGNEILTALSSTESGQAFVSQQLDSYRRTFGWRAVWSHEFIFPTFLEQPAPILEQVRGYLQTAYDYPAAVQTVRDDLVAASEELLAGLTGDDKEELASANAVNLRMAPLTPDHHFYIDQGSNARLRVVLMTIGSRLTAEGILDEPDDVMFLKYDELRHVIGDPVSARATQIVTARRAERAAAAARRPRDWIGTVTESALAFPYWVNWGYPERFYRAVAAQPESETASLSGIAGSPGLVEGIARVVLTTEEFDQVADGEILVCQMTNPAWVALFTKISGLVTDSGGTTSHPAVLAREFGIPAVVGTSVATHRIGTGDRIRVDGSSGTVSIQPRSSRQSETAELTFG